MNISTEDIKKLRELTGAGLSDVKQALMEAGSFEGAVAVLREKGHATLAKKSERTAKEGLIASYIHAGSRVGVLLEVNCETDFVARNEEFKKLVSELALHIAAAEPVDIADLLEQPYVRDSAKTIKDLIAETVGKLGENIQVKRFVRFVLGT